jgi:hypothetical protein
MRGSRQALSGLVLGLSLLGGVALPAPADARDALRPLPGDRMVRVPPAHRVVVHGGIGYRVAQGVWYAPFGGAWVVVQPPWGVVVPVLPAFSTVVVIDGVRYHRVHEDLYREVPGGYEAVAPPALEGPAGSAPPRISPLRGQDARQQADDRYACHRWAVEQTGFDPTGSGLRPVPAASAASPPGGPADYRRAWEACLAGRGYELR